MIDFFVAFPQSFAYVISAPYFWLSMGMTAAIAMFIGAIIYDGELEYMWKGLISVGMYGFFLFQVMITRVSTNFHKDLFSAYAHMAYANIVTVLIVSLFWAIGIIAGVFISSLFHKNHRKKGVKQYGNNSVVCSSNYRWPG